MGTSMQNVTKGQDFGATLSKWAQDRECLQAAEERRLLRHADFVGGGDDGTIHRGGFKIRVFLCSQDVTLT